MRKVNFVLGHDIRLVSANKTELHKLCGWGPFNFFDDWFLPLVEND